MRLLSVLPVIAVLAACGGVQTIPSESWLPPLVGAEAALARPGPMEVEVTTGVLPGRHGCDVLYEIHAPQDEPRTEAMVMLAHGFMRDLETMRGWAAHWASFGVPVTVMSLCNAGLMAGRQAEDADDLLSLAREVHDGPRLYAGFSSGGLAALLAAALDSKALAYLGLDPVDSDGLAAAASRSLDPPGLVLLAAPSSCNAANNIIAPLGQPPRVRLMQLPAATHCHFESPPRADCSFLCGVVEPAEAADRLRAEARVLATAWVLACTGAAEVRADALAPGPGRVRLGTPASTARATCGALAGG